MRDAKIKKDAKTASDRRVGDILQMAHGSGSKVDANPVIRKQLKSEIRGVKCAPPCQVTPPPSLLVARVSPTVIDGMYRTSLFQESSFMLPAQGYDYINLF